MRYVQQEVLYKAGYSNVTNAWKQLAEMLSNNAEDDENITKPFEYGISGKMTCSRFDDLMVFVERHEGHVLFHSGNDSEFPLDE